MPFLWVLPWLLFLPYFYGFEKKRKGFDPAQNIDNKTFLNMSVPLMLAQSVHLLWDGQISLC